MLNSKKHNRHAAGEEEKDQARRALGPDYFPGSNSSNWENVNTIGKILPK